MKKYKKASPVLLGMVLTLFFSVTASANSSWYWISETRPYDILPFVVAITLAIETVAINYVPGIKKLPKVFCFVALANCLSFAAPYVIKFNRYKAFGFGIDKYLDSWPSYMVGGWYLALTLLIEVPVVYFALRKNVEDRRKLLLTVFLVNLITTVIVAVFERLFCVGRW